MRKMAERLTFHCIGETFHFGVQNFHFLSEEFPSSERRILGSLFRAPLQFLSAKFEFSECRIYSVEFAFSEHRILGGLTRVFLSAKLAFSKRGISIL